MRVFHWLLPAGDRPSPGSHMSLEILKFGGTSVGSATAISAAAAITSAATRDHQVVVVASAMSGVTDALLRAAHAAVIGDGQTFVDTAAELERKHGAAARELINDEHELQALDTMTS